MLPLSTCMVIGPTELFGRREGWNNFDRTVRSGSFSWSIFKLTEPFGHELLIAVSSKRSPGFSCGLPEMAASYEGPVQPRRDGWSFRRDEWPGVGPPPPQTR